MGLKYKASSLFDTLWLALTAPIRLARRIYFWFVGFRLTPELEQKATVIMNTAIRAAFREGQARKVLDNEEQMVCLVEEMMKLAKAEDLKLLNSYADLIGLDLFMDKWSAVWEENTRLLNSE